MTKKLLFLLICFSMLLACKKNTDENQLKIRYVKSQNPETQKGIQILPEQTSINIYPNPFIEETNFIVKGEGKREIVVTNDEGKFKRITITDQNFKLDFSDEIQGSYYCEITVGNDIIPVTLIKAE